MVSFFLIEIIDFELGLSTNVRNNALTHHRFQQIMVRKLKRNITTSKVFSSQPRDVKRYNEIKLLLTRTHSLDYQRSTIELHVSNHFLLLDFFFLFFALFSYHVMKSTILYYVFLIFR